MSYCLNPTCQNPQNADRTQFCLNCGSKLLLRERYRAIKPLGRGGFGRTFLAIDEDKPSKPRCAIKQFFPLSKVPAAARKQQNYSTEKRCGWTNWGNTRKFPNCWRTFSRNAISIWYRNL